MGVGGVEKKHLRRRQEHRRPCPVDRRVLGVDGALACLWEIRAARVDVRAPAFVGLRSPPEASEPPGPMPVPLRPRESTVAGRRRGAAEGGGRGESGPVHEPSAGRATGREEGRAGRGHRCRCSGVPAAAGGVPIWCLAPVGLARRRRWKMRNVMVFVGGGRRGLENSRTGVCGHAPGRWPDFDQRYLRQYLSNLPQTRAYELAGGAYPAYRSGILGFTGRGSTAGTVESYLLYNMV